MWYISVSLPTNTKTIIWDCGREGSGVTLHSKTAAPISQREMENYWTYWRKFFFWFAKNYSLWLYPKYFMSSENLTKYYLTISLKWKGWTFLGNLVQIFSAKNRSWCDVSNKTISYVILYVWKALSEVRFYILDSSQVLFGEPSFGLSLITDNFYSAAIIVWMLTLMTWRVSVMQKYSQSAALLLIVANKEAGMDYGVWTELIVK